MKKIFVFIILLIICTFTSFSQSKVGYVNFNSILTVMPGIDSASSKLQTYQNSLTEQLNEMKVEFQTKYEKYKTQSSTFTDIIKTTKEKELIDLQSKIDTFQVNANKSLQAKQQEIIGPFTKTISETINSVAEENKYTLVVGIETTLYRKESDNLTPLVKKKLGLK